MKRLILPGWYGSGPGHWQRIWAASDPEAVVVEQDNWEEPDKESWIAHLHEALDRHPGAMLVGHSLGVILIPHYVARYPDAPISAALMVAPGDADLHAAYKPQIAGFAPVPRRRLPFPSIMVVSRTDPNMDHDRAVRLGEDLGAGIVDIGDAGHVNIESGFGEWPLGPELAEKLQARVENAPENQASKETGDRS